MKFKLSDLSLDHLTPKALVSPVIFGADPAPAPGPVVLATTPAGVQVLPPVPAPAPVAAPEQTGIQMLNELKVSPTMQVVMMASTGLSAYHGYKRTGSIGWALGWGLLGGLFPVITPAIALAQGFGKRK